MIDGKEVVCLMGARTFSAFSDKFLNLHYGDQGFFFFLLPRNVSLLEASCPFIAFVQVTEGSDILDLPDNPSIEVVRESGLLESTSGYPFSLLQLG